MASLSETLAREGPTTSGALLGAETNLLGDVVSRLPPMTPAAATSGKPGGAAYRADEDVRRDTPATTGGWWGS